MPTLYLIRHGNTFGPEDTPLQVGLKTDLPLVVKGKEQAKALGGFFSKLNITPAAIYSGNLKRQVETATGIIESLSVDKEIIQTPALNELDYGLWEGKTSKEIEDKWPEELVDWNEAGVFPKEIFETDEERFFEGIREFVSEIKEKHSPEDTVFAISSGGVIRNFYSFLAPEWRKMKRDRALKALKVSTGHYCKLEINKATVRIVDWNKPPT